MRTGCNTLHHVKAKACRSLICSTRRAAGAADSERMPWVSASYPTLPHRPIICCSWSALSWVAFVWAGAWKRRWAALAAMWTSRVCLTSGTRALLTVTSASWAPSSNNPIRAPMISLDTRKWRTLGYPIRYVSLRLFLPEILPNNTNSRITIFWQDGSAV